jgi:hypothetical protein
MWDVNLQMLDIMWKDGSWCNDIVISDSIPNVCVMKVNDPCVNCQVMGVPLIKKIWEVQYVFQLAYI